MNLTGSIQGGRPSNSKSKDPWVRATVDLDSNNGADFSEGFYLRFLTITPDWQFDTYVDNVKIYGTPT